VHQVEHAVHGVAGVGGVLGWVVNTLISALVGLAVGVILVAVAAVLPFGKSRRTAGDEPAAEHP
jgi:predicted DNA repair protein MutK